MRTLLVLVVPLVGACVYTPRSYRDGSEPFAGTRVELGGCLDLAIATSLDDDVRGHVLEYSFGNRCAERATVDLASVRAVERGGEGETTELVAYDPRREIIPLELEARWQGHERIEYRLATGAGPESPSICVDVGRVDRSAPPTTRWVCSDGVVTRELPGGV